ncbi:hypothetical protein H5V45_05540 [Nocardioides sp. KIGAM211]|uniref:Uncharacterized protein n=1 Tax=Nocardioides luti TaxID=2761101 RepID=A0A7X0RGV5_9ACTN|nr:hypothetical protein [Nocardioides luti]MBB6626779.1 hypothetical protein [Nocardioides luti]
MAMSRDDVLKTYRYLRLAMVLLVLFLAASVLTEVAHVHGACLQTSISAYYYTPAQAALVGTLVAIGVCLVALKGQTDEEDILLNIAGMAAPVVAVVPVPDPGGCASVDVSQAQRVAAVENNVVALLVVGATALLVTGVLLARDPGEGRQRRTRVLGLGLATLLLAAGAGVFLLARGAFLAGAHYAAAIVMFACIVRVVWFNATRRAGSSSMRAARTRYGAVALAMVLSLVVFGVLLLLGVDHAVLVVEVLLIGLFAVFWGLQTHELWDDAPDEAALRRTPPAR